jgi:hypothetical protein
VKKHYVTAFYCLPSFLSWRDELCQPVVRIGVAELCPSRCRRAKSISVTESSSLNHLIVTDQRTMGLFTGVLAKAITRVDSKLDQPPINVLAIFTQIGCLRIALPFNFRAVSIEQHALEPIPDNFLVVFWIRPANCRINILGEDANSKKANQEEDQLHSSRKAK